MTYKYKVVVFIKNDNNGGYYEPEKWNDGIVQSIDVIPEDVNISEDININKHIVKSYLNGNYRAIFGNLISKRDATKMKNMLTEQIINYYSVNNIHSRIMPLKG